MNSQSIGQASITGFAPHMATLKLSGPVDSAASEAFCKQFAILREDYRYEEIRIEIDSPGGALSVMRQVQRVILEAKAQGVLIQTHAHCLAASAAAILLSSGTLGRRSLNPEAHLLFHHSRLMAHQAIPLTAEMAGSAQEHIQQCDRWLLNHFQHQLTIEAGGPVSFVQLVANRAHRTLLRYDELVAELFVVPPAAVQQREEKKLIKQLSELEDKPTEAALKAHSAALRKTFDRDQRINLLLAYALGLIDSVDHIDLEQEPAAAPAPAPPSAERSTNNRHCP